MVAVVAVLVIVGDCSVDSCCSGALSSSLVIDESGSCTCSTIIDRCGMHSVQWLRVVIWIELQTEDDRP